MKTYITIFAISIAAYLSGCSGFLESNPKSFIAPDNFYQNREQAVAGVNAVYEVLLGANLYGGIYNYIGFGDVAANGFWDGSSIDLHTTNSAFAVTSGLWTSSYDGINRANTVIARVPAAAMSESDKNTIIAEARFLRGLLYFNLVRLFGGVPLHTDEVTSLNQIFKPRASEADVYETILSDWQMAAEFLPVPPSQTGRPTRGAALTQLARAYLDLGDFGRARTACADVMELNRYSLWQDYEDVFAVANENGKESIFEIQFKSNSSQLGNNKNFILPSKFDTHVVNGPVYRDMYVTEELFQLYEPSDTRLAINAISQYVVPSGEILHFEEPVNIKYLDGSFTTNIQDADNNFILARYADVLLMFAEAENEVNGTTSAAYEALNQVRRRAFGVALDQPSIHDLSGLSQLEFRQAVWDERFREFPLEGLHWFDLKRTGRLVETEQIAEYQQVYQIPLRELDINPLMEPNPEN